MSGGLSLCRPSGRPASERYFSATASLRSSFPYARRPQSRLGNPAQLRRSGGRRRFALSASRLPRCASLETRSAQPPPLRLRPASPTPGERGKRGSCQPTGSQPLLAFAHDSLCLPGYCRTDSGGNAAPKTLLPHLSASTGPAAFLAKPDHASFFAGKCNCQGSSHRSRSVGQRSLPGDAAPQKVSANTLAHPIIGHYAK